MIHTVSYSFSELTLDLNYLSAMLGFPDGVLPEPFDQYVAEAIQETESLCDIRGAFCFQQNSEFIAGNSCISVDGIEFGIGKTVAKELRNATSVALFVCTAGERISGRSKELLTGENPVLGYVFDVLGSMIVETATDQLQKEISRIANSEDLSVTNRYSPGYCKWSVGDQHKLFSFFPPNCCGISLTDSALMYPIKSVSGMIGLGKEVKFREYTCDLCSQAECFHRNYMRRSGTTSSVV
ncbi:MAG: vitamin B12 dependent-methionine synthase activation domain-containing protein [Bacteroidota bacterium]|nr:vitamin B12 dependent-methionine synthase activation domain-containing protein [Bacteroidota bacterium]